MKIRTLATLAATLLGPAIPAGGIAAQASDEGTLVIQHGPQEIGGESFRVVATDSSLRITAHTVYPGTRPPREFTVTVERSTAGGLAYQRAYQGPAGSGEVYAVLQRNRLTVRRVEKGKEQAREVPGSAALILVADSAFAPLLQFVAAASETPTPVQAFVPGTGRRLRVLVQRGPQAGGGTVVTLSGDLEGEIRLGDRGDVQRITLPSLGLDAVRRRE